jgi:hypothetical protein
MFMREEWFCSGPGGRVGPLSLEQLKEVLARNPHSADVYIWHESLPDWIRAGDFGGLDHIPGSQQPFEDLGQRQSAEVRRFDFGNYAPKEDTSEEPKKRFSIFGVFVGVTLMILGCVVFYLGTIGQFALVTEALDLNGTELDGSAGAVFFVAGLVVIAVTRYRVR